MTLNGNTVRRLRKDKKLSQFDVSVELGTDRQIISKIENNGYKNISLYQAFRLAKFFECKIEDML